MARTRRSRDLTGVADGPAISCTPICMAADAAARRPHRRPCPSPRRTAASPAAEDVAPTAPRMPPEMPPKPDPLPSAGTWPPMRVLPASGPPPASGECGSRSRLRWSDESGEQSPPPPPPPRQDHRRPAW